MSPTIVQLGEVSAGGQTGPMAPEPRREVVLGEVAAFARVDELWPISGARRKLMAEHAGLAASRAAWRRAMKGNMARWLAEGLELPDHVKPRVGERWRTFLHRYQVWARTQAKVRKG